MIHIHENFDCTQLVTMDYEGTVCLDELVQSLYKCSSFKVKILDEIRTVKKSYFKQHMSDYLYELENDDFMGEFEDWKHEDSPTPLLREFIEKLNELFLIPSIKNIRVFLVNYASEGVTKDKLISTDNTNLVSGMYKMSKYCFEIWTDVLILELCS